MNNISEDYISFPNAKLLKEKGFDVPCKEAWVITDELSDYPKPGTFLEEPDEYPAKSDYNDYDSLCSAPTQALVIKWLRIKHNIHIHTDVVSYSPEKYIAFINYPRGKYEDNWEEEQEFDTPEQAIEAAIEYSLLNLIK